MPVRYVIDKERRVVITTAWDRVTFAEATAHQDQLASDSEFNPEFNQLIDGTAVTEMDMSCGQTGILASRTLFSPTSLRAFVASTPAIYGMGRVAETYHEIATKRDQTRVFHDLPSAMKWLGLETEFKPEA